MRFPNQAPAGGRSVAKWDFVKLGPGDSWKGWMAGPMVEVNCHHRGGSHPCRHLFTCGKLKCADCKDGLPILWRGYMPLWDENGSRWYTVIGERYREGALALKFLEYVRVWKMESRGNAVRVDSASVKAPAPTAAIREREPADLTDFLLLVWKDRPLAQWLEAHPPKEPKLDALSADVSMADAMKEVVVNRLKEREQEKLAEKNADFLKQVNGKARH